MSVPIASPRSHGMLPHVQDGDLVSFHDGELPEAAAGRIAAHLAVCEPCAARSDALRDLSARLHAAAHTGSALPAALASPPWRGPHRSRFTLLKPLAARPARRRRASAAGTAVALVLLTAAAAAATPSVRAVVAAWMHPPTEMASVSSARDVERTGASGAPVDARGGALAFVPSDDTLRIAVSATAGDSLLVRDTGAPAVRVHFRVVGTAPTIITLPDRLRLASAQGSRTVYLIEVPPRVRMVEITDERRARVRTLRAGREDGAAWQVALP